MRNLKTFFSVIAILITSSFMAQSGYKVGDIATDFKLENVDGNMVSLSDYNQVKGFIVVFTCNTCPFSVAYEDRIIALNNTYEAKGYPVIAIMPNNPKVSLGDSMDGMKSRATAKTYTFPYLFDKNHEVAQKYGASKTPQVYVLKKTKKGDVVEYIGAIDDNYNDPKAVKQTYVEDAVNALLEGKPISETHTRATGCNLKI